jgi:hypothetical protein
LIFSLANGRVIGVQAAYLDKNGLDVSGKELIVEV